MSGARDACLGPSTREPAVIGARGALAIVIGSARARHAASWRALGLVLAAALSLASAGCSEKPPAHTLIWKPAMLPVIRASLTSVVTATDGRTFAIGFDRPEGFAANVPVAYVRTGAAWTFGTLPGAANGGSVVLLGAAVGPDGSVWAVGRTADYEPEPSLILPVAYRYAGGTWAEQTPSGLGDLSGVELRAIAASGTPDGVELRAVGSAGGISGIALRHTGGAWIRDPLPDPPGVTTWSLLAVVCGPDGRWFAAGGSVDGTGAVLYTDDGSGWSLVTAPGDPTLQLTALAFDPDGALWLGGNYSVGDSLQGALFRSRSGGFERVSIQRASTGGYQVHGLDFDAEGHGWVVGGRSGYQPFLAGSSGGAWTEAIAEIEHEVGASTGGGNLFAVTVTGAEAATAVGFKEEFDIKGLLEYEALIEELVIRPVGEIDLMSPPTAPPQRFSSRRVARDR